MIFLGQASNYNFGRTFRHLFAYGSAADSVKLKQALADRYQSSAERVFLYHSGRSALTAALMALPRSGNKVIVPGLTCIAVVRAIKSANYTPEFVDIDPKTLQYDFNELEKHLQKIVETSDDYVKNPAAKAPMLDKKGNVCYNGIIVAQNTLGLPLDMQRLEQIATKYNFCIVEDLAHSAGRFYPDGREVGTVGVATILSFGKGKAVDTICGGALILRSDQATSPAEPAKKPKLPTRLRDRWYPFLAGIARGLWVMGLGRPLLGLFSRMHWIEKSADTKLDLDVRLTHWQAKLALEQLPKLPKTPLRNHQFVPDRTALLKKLEYNGYYFGDTWYDVPVSPARYAMEANFPDAECPNTVKIAATIINFPTWYPEEKLAKAHEVISEHLADFQNKTKPAANTPAESSIAEGGEDAAN